MSSLENDTFIEEGMEEGAERGWSSPTEEHITIGMQVAVLLVGVVANTIVLYVYGRRGQRLTYTIAIVTLSARDLITCCLFLPWSIALEATRFATPSHFFCQGFHYFGNAMFLCLLPFLLLIALDRCACVCISHIQATYHRRAFIAVGVVILYSVSTSIVPTLAYRVNDSGICDISTEILSIDTILAFYHHSRNMFIICAASMALIYAATFGATLYQKNNSKQFILDSPLGDVGDKSSRDTASNSGESATSGASGGRFTAEEGRQLAVFQQEQISVTAIMFTLTLVLVVLYIPALLVVFRHIEGNLVLYQLHQISYVSNFFVYLCLEATFRKEVKNLFQSTWSRLQSFR